MKSTANSTSSIPVITVSAFKGGVSKSTTTLNIAWEFARHGKRVAVVDADPQCNLSQVFLQSYPQAYQEHVFRNPPDHTNPAGAAVDIVNIGEALGILVSGIALDPPPVPLIPHLLNENLLLLPGSMLITDYEQLAANAIESRQRILRPVLSGFYRLVQESAAAHHVDIILVDTSPSMGTLNKLILLFSDFYMVPCQADFFSLNAVRTLQRRIGRWMIERQTLLDFVNDYGRNMTLPLKPPVFLGAFIQMFTIQNGKPAAAYQHYIDMITREVNVELAQCLRQLCYLEELAPFGFNEASFIMDEGIYAAHGFEPFLLTEVKNFNRFAPMAQNAGVPVIALPHHPQFLVDGNGDRLRGKMVKKAKLDVRISTRPLERAAWLLLKYLSGERPTLAPAFPLPDKDVVDEADDEDTAMDETA